MKKTYKAPASETVGLFIEDRFMASTNMNLNNDTSYEFGEDDNQTDWLSNKNTIGSPENERSLSVH